MLSSESGGVTGYSWRLLPPDEREDEDTDDAEMDLLLGHRKLSLWPWHYHGPSHSELPVSAPLSRFLVFWQASPGPSAAAGRPLAVHGICRTAPVAAPDAPTGTCRHMHPPSPARTYTRPARTLAVAAPAPRRFRAVHARNPRRHCTPASTPVHPHPHFLPHARTRHTALHSSLQVSVGNYRADAFVNLVFLYVGFQVNLNKANEDIVEHVRDGTYYSGTLVSLQAQQQQQQPKAKEIEPPMRAPRTPRPRPAPATSTCLSPRFPLPAQMPSRSLASRPTQLAMRCTPCCVHPWLSWQHAVYPAPALPLRSPYALPSSLPPPIEYPLTEEGYPYAEEARARLRVGGEVREDGGGFEVLDLGAR
ncbi:hypothetical protein B0H14DRAFT_3494346 [Mycena olivaceomarginata]|nr:hypothetical protein B0H14DRAFT_3494346 [Mycena olivaceomarginata]